MSDSPNQDDKQEINSGDPSEDSYDIPEIEEFGDDVLEEQSTKNASGDLPLSSSASGLPTSNLAVVSLVAGILGMTIIPFLGSVVAVFTGHMARKEIRESSTPLGGDNFATAGLVLGYIGLGLGLLILCCAVTIILISFFSIATSNTSAWQLIMRTLV